VDTNLTLTADKVWVLSDVVHVTEPNTLTIEPCTRIEGSTLLSVLVVTRGAKIMAEGDSDHPILFTSGKPVGGRAAGDWNGVALFGKARNNDGDRLMEGLLDHPENRYGGNDDLDSSGSMKFVRIEYAGLALVPDVEPDALTLGSVGRGTTLSHIEVNRSLGDCFGWFGGTVNADHFICNTDGDDMFDIERGYSGTLDTAFGRKRANPSIDPHGLELDNNKEYFAAIPVSHPTVRNVTLCGFGTDAGATSYAMLLRRGTTGVIDNLVAVGFDHGVDLRDDVGTLAAPRIDLTNTIFFDMRLSNIANATEVDNDMGFDEAAWFNAETGNSAATPGFNTLECSPSAADSPPDPKVMASHTGAFKNGNWLTGRWIDWHDR
jgi:hypothetical protein